jgi:hypothetical protein
VSPLTVPFGKSGVKKEDVMERCRARLVAALKTGGTFALYLGEVRLEHADFKTKLCKKVTSRVWWAHWLCYYLCVFGCCTEVCCCGKGC